MDSERKRREELESEVFHLRGEYNVPTTCYEVKQDLCFDWSIQISFPGYLRKRYENSQRCLIQKNMIELGRFDPKSF